MATKFEVLTKDEMDELFLQHPSTANDGGFQNFLVGLQKQARRPSLEIKLSLSGILCVRHRMRSPYADTKEE